MNNGTLVFCFGVILAAITVAALPAQDQDISLSGKLDEENVLYGVAVSTKTGDALVVWERRAKRGPDKIIEGVYSVFAKRKKDGRYKAKKPLALWCYDDSTGSRDINYQEPDVVYNPDRNEFLVVYSSGTNEIAFAQIVNARGKKRGPRRSVMPEADPEDWINSTDCTGVKIHYMPGSGAPGASGSYVAFFRHDYTGIQGRWDIKDDWGVHAARLDDKGQITGERVPLFPNLYYGSHYTAECWIGGIENTPDGGLMVGYSQPFEKNGSGTAAWYDDKYYVANLAKLNSDLKIVKTEKVGGKMTLGPEEIVALSKNLYLTVWMKDCDKIPCQKSDFNNSLYNGKLKRKKKTVNTLPGQYVFKTSTVKLAKDNRFYQVIAPHYGTAVYGRFISSSGKMSSPVKLFDTGSNYVSVQAAAIPGTNDIFIAWSRSDDFIEAFIPNWEIRGYITTPK